MRHTLRQQLALRSTRLRDVTTVQINVVGSLRKKRVSGHAAAVLTRHGTSYHKPKRITRSAKAQEKVPFKGTGQHQHATCAHMVPLVSPARRIVQVPHPGLHMYDAAHNWSG